MQRDQIAGKSLWWRHARPLSDVTDAPTSKLRLTPITPAALPDMLTILASSPLRHRNDMTPALSPFISIRVFNLPVAITAYPSHPSQYHPSERQTITFVLS